MNSTFTTEEKANPDVLEVHASKSTVPITWANSIAFSNFGDSVLIEFRAQIPDILSADQTKMTAGGLYEIRMTDADKVPANTRVIRPVATAQELLKVLQGGLGGGI